MSYFVACTFDLKNAVYQDYQNAYADLATIGLQKTVVSSQGNRIVAPTTMTTGEFNGQSAASVRDYVRDQVKARLCGTGFVVRNFRYRLGRLGLGRSDNAAMTHHVDVSMRVNAGQAYFDELAATRLGGGIHVRATLTWDHEKGLSWSGELPPDDDLAAYLHRLRPFVLQNDETSFDNVCAIIGRALPYQPTRALLRRQRREFDGRNFQSQFQLLSNDVVVNSERVLKLWLNGFEYHRDRQQREEIARLHQLLPMDATRPVFVAMIIDKARAVAEIAKVVRVLLRQAERGREVRFDKLDIRYERAND